MSELIRAFIVGCCFGALCICVFVKLDLREMEKKTMSDKLFNRNDVRKIVIGGFQRTSLIYGELTHTEKLLIKDIEENVLQCVKQILEERVNEKSEI